MTKEEELRVVDEWIKYQEFEFSDEDYKCRVDHFWSKVFQREDTCGEKFVTLPKMVKCALALCHSNADVERSLSINKKVVTKQNTKMMGSTITGLRAVKTAVQDFEGVDKVPVTKEMVKIIQQAHALYQEELRKEKEDEKQKQKRRWLRRKENERQRKLKISKRKLVKNSTNSILMKRKHKKLWTRL